MQPRLPHLALSIGTLAALAAGARAQVPIFAEDFDALGPTPSIAIGPPELEAAGWQFRIQDGQGGARWRRGEVTDHGYPHTYPHTLLIDSLPFPGQPAAAWAVLPDVPAVVTGNQIVFRQIPVWLHDADPADWFELRWSPSGGTSTGTAWNDVGDFTVNVPLSTDGCFQQVCWLTSAGDAPGDGGRYAIRYVYDTWHGGSAPQALIDTLEILPTNPAPPIPDPGQTVHWTPALNPITILTEYTVPPGATLVVDAGTVVEFQGSGAKLVVNGELRCEGTAASKVHLRLAPGETFAPQRISVGYVSNQSANPPLRAELTMEHTVVELGMGAGGGSPVRVTNCLFDGRNVDTDGAPHLSPGFGVAHATLFMQDTTFVDSQFDLTDAWVHIRRVVFDDAPVRLANEDASTPTYVNECAFNNVVDGAPLVIQGQDVLLGPDNVHAGNRYPLALEGGGLRYGSRVPAGTNAEDSIPHSGGTIYGVRQWANTAVPYLWRYDPGFNGVGGVLSIEPGTTIEFEPDGLLWATFGSRVYAHGTPEAPITFRSQNPLMPWSGIQFVVNQSRPHMTHCIVEGAGNIGVRADECRVWLDDCVIRDSQIGAYGTTTGQVVARNTQFLANEVGIQASAGSPGSGILAGSFDADGTTNPNAFVGNASGAVDLNQSTSEEAEGNWWGSPSGPSHPQNPSGTGDSADASVDVLPYRTSPPDFGDTAPRVKFERMYGYLEPGDRVILHWTVEDDGEIVDQRLEYTPHSGNPPLSVVVSSIPPDRRSIELEVPPIVPSSNIDGPVWRIVAIDDAGQEGFDDTQFTQVDDGGPLNLQVQTDLSAGVLVGQRFPFVWLGVTGDTTMLIDDLREFVRMGQAGYDVGLDSGRNRMPAVSTDLVRYQIVVQSTSFDIDVYQTPYFTIRPEAAVTGDAPPVVTLQTPAPGSTYSGGSAVPITWTASDDSGELRSFDVQASYDGGFTWHFVTDDLPGTARHFDWQLPPSSGIPEVRVRVIGRDLRFQATSDGTHRAFTLLPGDPCAAPVSYCTTSPNSSGPGARISAGGSAKLSDANLRLRVSGARPNAPGLFFYGTTQTSLPFGHGVRCVGGPIQRLPIQNCDPAGGAERVFDGAAAGLVPDDVRHFQFWYRDAAAGSPGFNLSDGLAVQFCP